MRVLFFPFLVTILSVISAAAVDYKSDILPIMKERCWECHSNETKVKGNLALDDLEEVRDYQVGEFNLIRPGNPEESNFLERLMLDSNHTDFMPRKAEPLPKSEIQVIEDWIRAGAVIDAENPSDEEKKWVSASASGGLGTSGSMKESFHKWTNSAGKEIEARLLSIDGENVQLLLKNGKKYSVPMNSLSAESVAKAKELAGS